MLTNKLNLPEPFVQAASDQREIIDGQYSVTEILKGTREIILSRRHADEITEDVSDRIWLIFGTAVHKILEQGAETTTQIKEGRIETSVLGCKLTGIFDLYDGATGTVTDYKTASVWKVIYDEWDDYKMQLIAYCWILRRIGFDAHRGRIVALLKDHSKTKAAREVGYPPYPVYTVDFDFTDDDFDAFGMWAYDKIAEIRRYESMPDEDLPLCTTVERWHRGEKWAVMKQGRKKAVKLYDDRADADIHALEIGGYVEHREGKDGKCEGYCRCREFCSHYRATHAD